MRPIDADALKDRLDYCVKEGMGSTIAFTFKHMVDDAPTIEPKRGEWLEWIDCEGEVFWKCSACGQASEASAAGILYKFCPFCGAKMKGADDE